MLKLSRDGIVSTQQIADKAGVSTATLYRWWDTKEAILLDAFIEHYVEKWPYPKSGSPLARLRRQAVRTTRFLKSEDGRIFRRLMFLIQEDAALRQALFQKLYVPRRAEARLVVEEAIAAGELPSTVKTDLLIEMVHAPQFRRLFIGNEELSEKFAREVFDFAIAGALASAPGKWKPSKT